MGSPFPIKIIERRKWDFNWVGYYCMIAIWCQLCLDRLQNNLPIQTILMHNLPNEVEEQLVMGLMNRLLEESAL